MQFVFLKNSLCYLPSLARAAEALGQWFRDNAFDGAVCWYHPSDRRIGRMRGGARYISPSHSGRNSIFKVGRANNKPTCGRRRLLLSSPLLLHAKSTVWAPPLGRTKDFNFIPFSTGHWWRRHKKTLSALGFNPRKSQSLQSRFFNNEKRERRESFLINCSSVGA